MEREGSYSCAVLSFSLYLSRVFFFFFFMSRKMGKFANHEVARVGFSSQWEHSMIPASLDHRVNTFFSQAQNSQAKDRALEKEGEDGQGEGEENCNKSAVFQNEELFSIALSFSSL